MKKLLFFAGLLITLGASAQTFPSSDSLENFIDRYIRTSAINAFTNMRLNTALHGVIDLANAGGGADTTSLSDRINGKLSNSDTAAMLADYRTGLLARLLYTDTSAMFSAYRNALLGKVNISDTAAMLSAYLTLINNRVKYSDTATILSAYQTALNSKLNKSDTSSVLADYRTALLARMKYSDTASLSDRIDLKADAADFSNVDNTSDAEKNSATATLTNKTIDGDDNTLQDIAQGSVKGLGDSLDLKAYQSALTDTAEALVNRIDQRPIIITLNQLRSSASLVANDSSIFFVRDQGYDGIFYYDADDASSADDTATIIVNGDKRFKRYIEGIIYPEWWGAVGDGTTDDGPAFNKMYRWMERAANRSYTIAHKHRKYLINTTIDLPHALTSSGSMRRININGNGVEYKTTSGIKVLRRDPADQSDALNTMISAYALTIEGLKISGDGDAGQVGMDLSALHTPIIEGCYFEGLDTGVVAKYWLNAVIKNNLFVNNISVAFKGASGSDYWSSATTSNSAFNACTFSNNKVGSAPGAFAGLMLFAADGLNVEDHISEGYNPRYDIYLNSQGSTVVNGNVFKNIWFESNGGTYTTNTCFYLRTKGGLVIDGIQNDYADTLIKFDPSMTSGKIIAKNWYYVNAGSTGQDLFDGNSTLQASVSIEVGEMPSLYNTLFFDTTRWVGGVLGATVLGVTHNTDNSYGLRTGSSPLKLDAGTNTINLHASGTNLYGGAFLRLWGGTDLTNYNRLGVTQSSGTASFDIAKSGAAGDGAYVWSISSVNKLALNTANLITSVGLLPGTDNLYDLGRTSGPLRFRTGYFGTSLGVGVTAAPNSSIQTQSLSTALAAKTAAYTATINDHTITGDATSAAFDITLPTAVGITGRIYVIKKVDASANAVTVKTTSSQTIDGATTYDLSAQWKYVTVQSDGANWIIIGSN